MDKKKKQKSAAFKEDKGAFTGHEEKKTATKKAQKRASDNQPRDADSTFGQDAQNGNESETIKNDFSKENNSFTEEEKKQDSSSSQDDYRRRDTYHQSQKKGKYRRREYQDRERTKHSDFEQHFQTQDTTFKSDTDSE